MPVGSAPTEFQSSRLRGVAATAGQACLRRSTTGWRAAFLAAVAITAACGGSPTSPTPGTIPGFTLAGDPASASGATWVYRADVGGVHYDLEGILFKPQGSGPFPAVVISHGLGGSAGGYSSGIAHVMVGWGLVCIATNYTHAGGVAIGSPGSVTEPGASPANIQRARQLVELLRAFGYVDINRIALHGHSFGAFVTTALAGTYPQLFRAASHTAGGMLVDLGFTSAVPTSAEVAAIRAPYQMHHGDRDVVVPLLADQLLDAALTSRGAVHQLFVYPGSGHEDIGMNTTMLDRVRAWYAGNGMF